MGLSAESTRQSVATGNENSCSPHPILNKFGQSIGQPIPGWRPVVRPPAQTLRGRYVDLEPIGLEHAEALFESLCQPGHEPLWTYRSDERPTTLEATRDWVRVLIEGREWTTYAVVPRGGSARGVTSLLRDDPRNGSIEIGGVLYSPTVQRTPVTTEATWLLARLAFDELGYRRLEWKLDSLNAPSEAAARRLGFADEGLFIQHMVYKGRNRDTRWFALTSLHWPRVDAALRAWLDPKNFDAEGRQRRTLVELRASSEAPSR